MNSKLHWALFLDASQAFDRISHSRLIKVMRDCNISKVEITRIMTMMRSNIYRVRWNGLSGDAFQQRNGIKQGGLISPILFSACYNSIIETCQQHGPSVSLKGGEHISILAYADDIVLLSYSLHGVLSLFREVACWAEFDIAFNKDKSILVTRGTLARKLGPTINTRVRQTLKAENLEFAFSVDSNFKYLGVNMNAELEAQTRARAIYAATHRVCNNAEFKCSRCTVDVKRQFFKAFIIGTLYCISCSSKLNQKIVTAYRYSMLKFYGSDPTINILNINGKTTRSSTLSTRAKIPSVGEVYRARCHGLYTRMAESDNSLVKSYREYALYSSIDFFEAARLNRCKKRAQAEKP